MELKWLLNHVECISGVIYIKEIAVLVSRDCTRHNSCFIQISDTKL